MLSFQLVLSINSNQRRLSLVITDGNSGKIPRERLNQIPETGRIAVFLSENTNPESRVAIVGQ